jgi:hypothetical protein
MRNASIAAVLGAVCGALFFWLLTPRAVEPRDSGDLSTAVAELRESIALLRASLDARPPASATPSGPQPRSDPGSPPRERETVAPDASPTPSATQPSTPTRAPGRAPLPAPNRNEVSALLRAWVEEEHPGEEFELARSKGVRRQWLFATQDEILAAFGTPDDITGGADEERWTYWQFEARNRVSDVVFVFWDGRLRRVQY